MRYEVALRAAAEFVLRKDYRADWGTEVLEEYTYFSQPQFEEAFRSRGLRIVTSRPLWNPWIVQNRFEGKFHLTDLGGNSLLFPPTNYLIVGEKVPAGSGVELFERKSRTVSEPAFLSLKGHRHKESGQVMELAERPRRTIDVLPWFESEGQIFVVAKKDFPRPIINAAPGRPRLDSAHHSGYVTEPVSAIIAAQADEEEEVYRVLRERAGFDAEDIVRAGVRFSYFTSPGGVNELVISRLVEVRPRQTDLSFPNYTPFTDAGTVRELDATQVLRACQVGGMFDSRLEINIYSLLRELGRGCGPWIGAPIALSVQPHSFAAPDPAQVMAPAPRAAFGEPEPLPRPRFLSLCEGSFVERDGAGATLAEASFEYVRPGLLSNNTLVVLPALRTAQGVFVGVEHRDLPAVQSFSGSSVMAAAPAWRLPPSVTHLSEIPPFLKRALRRNFNLDARMVWELGGAYFPTPGVTPEVIYPFVVEVDADECPGAGLQFVSLSELTGKPGLLQDAHLLVVIYRLAHALGLLS